MHAKFGVVIGATAEYAQLSVPWFLWQFPTMKYGQWRCLSHHAKADKSRILQDHDLLFNTKHTTNILPVVHVKSDYWVPGCSKNITHKYAICVKY